VVGAIWLGGLWVIAVSLFILSVVLLFYRESARLIDGRLIHVARIGPTQIVMEYELAKVRNLRADEVGKDRAVVRFDYDNGHHRLGDDLTPADAEARVKMIQGAIDRLRARRPSEPGPAAAGPTGTPPQAGSRPSGG
jgi:hypothetical protein